MELYLFALIILASLAIFDLMVGVSNDAVNFLNSSIGSRVAPRYVIVIIASLGILAGVTFSSGMMEVARKGIFHPKLFLMPELITIFLAVMLTDVILLDLFNTYGLPTSTTVSIVFELLGAAVAVSILKILQADNDISTLAQYINTSKAMVIIFGILISVIVAFVCGMIAQFLSRLLFTFDFTKRLKRYGGIWGGVALSSITYFILVKGAKGSSIITPETTEWIISHTFLILLIIFGISVMVFLPGSRKAGLKTSTMAGMITRAPIRQIKMDAMTRKPKYWSGENNEKGRAQNPSITDRALKLMPLPVVVSVFLTALTGSSPLSLSDLYLHRKCMV